MPADDPRWPPSGPTKVLVTGASGFIGRHLVQQLRDSGALVRVFGRHVDGFGGSADPVECMVGDIRHAGDVARALRGVSHVFHLAGKAHDMREAHGTTEHHAVTTEGTRHLLRSARENAVERLVFLSSVAVYGRTGDAAVDEETRCAPETAYGRAKLEAEAAVIEAGAQMHVCCLRAPLVYGPGGKGQLPRLIALIERGFVPPLPDVANARSMVSVDDLVQSLIRAVRSPGRNRQIYNVTDGRAYTTREIVRVICGALGRRVPGWHAPLPLLRILARLGDAAGSIAGRKVPFDSDVLEKLIGSAHFSAAKIERDLGYRPTTDLARVMPAIIAARK